MTDNKTDKVTLSPSSSSRWLECPGSAFVNTKGFPITSNDFAALGTQLHAVAEKALEALKTLQAPENSKAFKILPEYQDLPAEHKHWIDFYVNRVLYEIELLQTVPGNEKYKVKLETEKTFYKTVVYEDKEYLIQGTIDCLLTLETPETFEAVVIDLKTGYNEVEAEDNTQLKIYGHLVCDNVTRKPVKTFKAVIVQPSLGQSMPEIMPYDPEFLKATVEYIATNRATYRTGSHCLYCPVNDVCPHLSAEIDKYLSPAFEDTPIDRADVWSKRLQIAGAAIKVFEKIQSEAKIILESGRTIPGFELAYKGGKRVWNRELTPEKLATVLGIEEEQVFKKVLESPKGIEELLEALGVSDEQKAKLTELYYQPPVKYLKKLKG